MIESKHEKVKKYLSSKIIAIGPILEIPLINENIKIIDLSKNNPHFHNIKIQDPEEFDNLILNEIKNSGAKVGVGGYLEDRLIYNQSENFNGDERRTIHLGIDLWVKPQTVVYAPLEGKVHSYANNEGLGNYGPTIILEHNITDLTFYTLYGHLTRDSLKTLKRGSTLKTGALLGRIGTSSENGGWPAHLHFQIITDLEGNYGDFPGVSAPSSLSKYVSLCPDPNLILKIDRLN